MSLKNLPYEQTDWNQEVRDNDQNSSDDTRLTALESKTAQIATNGQDATITGNWVGANILATNETRLAAVEGKAIFDQVNVKDYGAVGDGVTDDTAAIGLAKAACSSDSLLYFPPSGDGYLVSGQLAFDGTYDVVMDGKLVFDIADTVAAVTIGSASESLKNRTFKINVSKLVTSDWLNEGSIGVKFLNLSSCNIEVVQAVGFTIGIQYMGSAAGVSYNYTKLGEIASNKIGVDLTNELSGWVNENEFHSGRFTVWSGTHTTSSRYGVRITSSDASYVSNNNNIFYKPSFEGTVSAPGENLPILIEHGLRNSFYDVRMEGSGSLGLRAENASQDNRVVIGYGSVRTLEDNGTYETNTLINSADPRLLTEKTTIFQSGNLVDKAVYYNANLINIAGITWAYNSSSVLYNHNLATGVSISGGYIVVSGANAIGIRIHTDKVKRFFVNADCETGYGGRRVIRCFDSGGSVLDVNGDNDPYIKGSGTHPFLNYSSYGGSYRPAADSIKDTYFTVHDDVKYIDVLFAGGSAALHIRSFTILADKGYDAPTTVGYEEVVPGANLASQAPAAGTYKVGRIIYNDAPSAGGSIGWVCTTAGTPGTWKTFGAISA